MNSGITGVMIIMEAWADAMSPPVMMTISSLSPPVMPCFEGTNRMA